MSLKTKQQGFVLVSVLLITTVSTMLAFSSIGENKLQERIAGNQIKEINARATAEKGLFAGYAHIQERQAANDTITEIKDSLNGQSLAGKYVLTAVSSATASTLLITSKGEYHGAVAYLKAEMVIENGVNLGTPGGAVVACEGVSLTGGGLINSYDSREGAYSSESATSNADVVTINGNVNIKGGTNLKGDLNVNGNVTQSGSTTIGGDIAASGDVTLAQATVEGSINAGNNATIEGGKVGLSTDPTSGNVNVSGDFELNDSARSEGALNYGGNLTKHYDSYDIALFSDKVNQQAPTAPTMAANKCNEKDIANALPTVNGNHTKSNMKTAHKGALAQLEFNETSAQVFNQTDTSKPFVDIGPSQLSSTLWEDNKPVYVFDQFNLKNTMITIVGDVTIMVTGQLTTTGGGTGFRFNDNDTNSSLTILAEGTVDIGSSTSVFENAVIDSVNQKVPLTIYSSFESSGNNATTNAVYLDGAANMYAKVYAPLGKVEYAASGAMMGSLEGKDVNISGAGKIHYDEALKFVGEPIMSGDDSVKFASVYYYYPE